MESNIFGKLLTSNIIPVILGVYPPPLTPLDLYLDICLCRGGGLNEGGDLMSLTPQCDMFLGSVCNAEVIQHLPEAEWPSGLRLGYKWVTSGLQVDYEWVTSGL